MKPKGTKVSTGYLTPQTKKNKPAAKNTRLSDRDEENEVPDIDPKVFEALLHDPDKKKMIMQLLSLNKGILDKHNGEAPTTSLANSVDKLKSKKTCESPTALMRRRALEKMNGSPSTSRNILAQPLTSSSGSSTASVTLDAVLKGVRAYVEIRDRQNQDKSQGAKEILKSMGATIEDQLTRKVTHVVFKDGSYKTFQKAKLLKVHIVSILWVEFSRKALQRANEKRFPAMNNEFEDETIVCSQMHKEYEDIIRDEYRKSILQGTPLPTTKALINRRRTLMTPSVTNSILNASDSSYNTAISSQDTSDHAVTLTESIDQEELIMNDPEGLTLGDKEIEKETPKGRQRVNTPSFDRRKTIGSVLFADSLTANKNSPQLQVSIKKLNLVTHADSFASSTDGTEINVEEAISAVKSPTNVSLSSNDSEVLLPSVQRKSRKTLGAKAGESLARRKTMATTSLERRRLDLDTSSDSMELSVSKTATARRKTLALTQQPDSTSSCDSLTINLAPSQTLQNNLRSDELTLNSNTRQVRARKAKALESQKMSNNNGVRARKHVTGDASDSDGESVTDAKGVEKSQKLTKRLRKAAPKKHITADASDSDTDSLEPFKEVEKPALESQKLTINKTSTKPVQSKPGVSDSSSSSDKSVTKSRRLYNPDMSVHLVDIDDEKERQEKREQKKKKRLEQEGFVNPVAVVYENLAKSASESSESEPSPPKRTRKAVKEPQKPASTTTNTSDDDEQRQLLDEVLKRPKPIESRRKSLRIISQSAKKPTNSKPVPASPAYRRSTMDFIPKTQTSRKKMDKGKLPTIVCTKLHKPEVQVFTQIVKKLGRFVVEDEVSNRTTHVVAGEAKRTLNMLRAIARGCWVLKHEWVLRSLEAGKWLPEENYEVDDFSPSVQKCRLERQAFGSNYTMDVFDSCPPVYVSLGTNPRCSDLRDLIRTCKGKVVTAPRMARIIVGQYMDEENVVCVTEKWVLDCVTFYKKMDLRDYLIEKGGDKRKSVAV